MKLTSRALVLRQRECNNKVCEHLAKNRILFLKLFETTGLLYARSDQSVKLNFTVFMFLYRSHVREWQSVPTSAVESPHHLNVLWVEIANVLNPGVSVVVKVT